MIDISSSLSFIFSLNAWHTRTTDQYLLPNVQMLPGLSRGQNLFKKLHVKRQHQFHKACLPKRPLASSILQGNPFSDDTRKCPFQIHPTINMSFKPSRTIYWELPIK